MKSNIEDLLDCYLPDFDYKGGETQPFRRFLKFSSIKGPSQGIETAGAGPNVRPQPVCRDSGNRRSRTRVRSPHPLKEARKRRAIFYDYNKKWKKTSMLGRARASADEADRAVGTSVIWMLRVSRLYLARGQPPLHTLTPVSTRLGLNRSGQGNFDLPLGLLPRNSVLVIHPSAFHVWLFPTKCGTPPAHPIGHQRKNHVLWSQLFSHPQLLTAEGRSFLLYMR